VVIVGLDQLVWRPIVVWSQRFKLEDTSAAEQPQSWFLELMRHSMLIKWLMRAWTRRHEQATGELAVPTTAAPPPVLSNGPINIEYAPEPPAPSAWLARIKWIVVFALTILAAWGTYRLAALITTLPFHDTAQTKGWAAVLWAMFISFWRVFAAVAIGGLWTLPAGVLIGLSPRWSNRLQPFVQILASFPAPMIYLMMCALLVGKMHIAFTIGCIFLMLLGTQWYTLFNVIAGAMAIPTELREAASVFHFTSRQRWTTVILPGIFPYLVTGLVTASGGAWNASIVAEYVHFKKQTLSTIGLGAQITAASEAGNYSVLLLSTIVMAILVVCINRLVWRPMYRLAETRYRLEA
jgi:NitT/TauT family transport system permease protein